MSKQKYYCYTVTEILLANDESRTPTYIRENAQSKDTYQTVQEAFQSFLMNECYDSNIDTDVQFQTSSNDDVEVVSLGFSKLLKENGSRPSKEEIILWKSREVELFERSFMCIIYEFECKPLTLRQLKRGIKKVDA